MTTTKPGPTTAPPGVGARGVWRWRDYPTGGWLVAVVVVSLVHPFVPHSRWLMVHLVLLGALTHSAMVWSTHFTQALLKTDPALDDRRRQSRRLALLAAGVTLVLTGVTLEIWAAAVTGAVAVVAAVAWHAIALWRRLRASIAGRFRITVHYYLAAAACVPIGATLGAILARGQDDAWQAKLLVAHTTVLVLGWVGLTAAGTLITLWPTMLRTRLDARAERLATQALPVFAVAIATTGTAALTGARAIAVAGLVGYLAAAVWWGRALWRPARARPPAEYSSLAVAFALGWAVIAIGWIAGTVALRTDWVDIGETYGVPTALLAAGFAPQLLIGALSYLVPSVLGGGPHAVRAAAAWVDRYAVLRLVLVNGGLALSLLPVPGPVRVLTTSLVLAAYTAFVPLLLLAVRASLRIRAGGAPAPAPPLPTASPATSPTTPAPVTPATPAGPRLTSVWSSGQLVAGFATLALAVVAGVLVDPQGAGLVPSGGAVDAQAGVVATGRTTTVQVQARDMRYVPDRIDVAAGDRLVIELVNVDPTTTHDLVLANGRATARLRPQASATLDAGVVGRDLDGWCSIVGHRQMGMRLTIKAVGAPTDAAGSGPAGAAAAGASGHNGHGIPAGSAGSGDEPTPLDLHTPPDPSFTAVDPVLAPAEATTEHRITLTVKEIRLHVAPGVWQLRWAFNGTVPGPTLRGRVGDVFVVTLVNDASMGHSIDFHAGALAPDRPMRTIPPGQSLVYRFTATRAGIWMYHCSTMPMSVHIGAGMFGAVVIDPPDLPRVDREFLMVQSEIFLGPDRSAATPSEIDAAKVAAERPDAVVFNGVAAQYDHRPLTARVGERVRIWVLVAGPNRPTAFHVVGGQFDTTYAEGRYLLRAGPGGPDAPGGSQVLGLAAAQGGFVELTFPEAGHYPVVSHLMVDAERGAHGIVAVQP